jgi:hypothetical protein
LRESIDFTTWNRDTTHLPRYALTCYMSDMTKTKKSPSSSSKSHRDSHSGQFVVAKPAVTPKGFQVRQIRDAVRTVVKGKSAKPK